MRMYLNHLRSEGNEKVSSSTTLSALTNLVTSAAEDEDESRPAKGKRMTTNKKSASNFYTTAVS